ncbi:MAG: PD40 domain-containing protein [Planctomycetes bacterium]|nr:PD40 domain-containing protein [Planctomycetota bacterium]
MMTLLRSMLRVTGLLALACGFYGCTTIEWRLPFVRAQPTPRLAVAGDPHITLFGELPGVRTASYSANSNVSLYQHTYPAEGADFDPDVDPLGERLVFASTRHSMQPDLYVQRVFGTAVTQLTADPAADVQPVFSPDGRRVAFASDRGGAWDIWVIGVDGSPPVQITDSPGDELHPSWSPDGTQLAYCRRPANGGPWELWITSVASGGRQRFIGYGLFPEWSPFGDTLVYQRARERGSHWFGIWTIELIDGEPRYPTEVASSSTGAFIVPTWSPDGLRIAFGAVPATPPGKGSAGPEEQRSDIWIVDREGGRRFRLSDGRGVSFSPVWAVTGRVFFTSRRGGIERIWSMAPGGDLPTPGLDAGDKVLSRLDDPQRPGAMKIRPASGT